MKIIRQIPNTITCLNLLCGVFGVLQALEGHLDIAFYLMLAGAACDFCDGMAARLLNAYSPMGKELDSLADLITFGLLPAVMLYKCMDWYNWGQWICYIPFIITVFSALRLAKFNVDDRQGENFIGLATPACAMICGSFAAISYLDINNIARIVAESTWMIPVASALLSLLLISNIPMFSMKFKKGAPVELKWIRMSFIIVSAIAVAVTLILGQHFSHAVLFIFIAYILMNIVSYPFHKK
ncbi:MAG: CDP-diacylglycerol--serine O-phosphatidyltransferase [Bacteroidales bacterium]|nr:CDP-diacylglycerol--serine O-phosphatidyltransferase [Bacteroidales bacterium]